MIRNFFQFVVRRTHYWRHIGFAELAELYTSRMLRIMALQMIAGFSSVYMYQLGYSLQFIALFWLCYFFLRVCMAPLIALTVARVGPKHGTLLSNIGQIIGAFMLVLLPEYGMYVLVFYAFIAGFSRSLYDVCYLVDFSKVKHVDHAGKELGIMQIFERIVTSLGPLLGGVIALFFGPQIMFVFASVLLLIAALPLFFTSEPVKTHQKITLRHFNWKVAWRPILGNIGVGIDTNLSAFVWYIFLAICVLGMSNNNIYAQIGALSSVSMLATIACAFIYGKLVDRHQGKLLLRLSVIGDAVLHLLRPFVSTPTHAVGMNVANDIATTGYSLPATRGIFDTADGLPGYRIVYMSLMGAMLALGDTIVLAVLAALTFLMNDNSALHAIYFIAGPAVLLIIFHNHALYRRGILTKFIHRV